MEWQKQTQTQEIGLSHKDRKEVIEYIEIGIPLSMFNDTIRGDKDLVLECIKISSVSFQYATPELQTDKEVCLEAVKNDIHTIEYVPSELRKKYGETPKEFITNLQKELNSK